MNAEEIQIKKFSFQLKNNNNNINYQNKFKK